MGKTKIWMQTCRLLGWIQTDKNLGNVAHSHKGFGWLCKKCTNQISATWKMFPSTWLSCGCYIIPISKYRKLMKNIYCEKFHTPCNLPYTLQRRTQNLFKDLWWSSVNGFNPFSPVSHFYTPWKRQKTFGFLPFSGSIEMWH